MARKTKAEAEQTRERLIEAARRVFLDRGVARSTLEAVAAAAGVTRGAIYWHFANKTELFMAMRDRVCLPFFDRMEVTFQEGAPLAALERFLSESIRILEEDAVVRETMEIIFLKCEFVGEFSGILGQMNALGLEFVERLSRIYRQSGVLGDAPETLARETFVFFVGLHHMWLADKEGLLVRPWAMEMIRGYVTAMGKTANGA